MAQQELATLSAALSLTALANGSFSLSLALCRQVLATLSAALDDRALQAVAMDVWFSFVSRCGRVVLLREQVRACGFPA